jgi:hypothetical protein
MLSASIGFAQTTTGDIGKGPNTTLGANGGSVRVIDNKGTIKYLQSNNGLTTFTDTTPVGGVVTTWQLGGALTEDTNITTGDKEFKITLEDVGGVKGTFILDGVALETGPASADAATGSSGGTATGSGWTFLVRDEATGETRKLEFDNFITSEYKSDTYSSSTATPGSMTFTISALPLALSKTWVYRNGIKLISGIDYSVSPPNTLLITPPAPLGTNVDWQFYDGDVITVQVLKF